MTTTTEKPGIHCVRCNTERKTSRTRKDGLRLPPSWKWDADDKPVCGDCWRKAYVLRAVTIPVAEPVDATKDEMWAALRTAWEASTTAANVIVQEMLRADFVRLPSMEKIPPMPKVYAYGNAVHVGFYGMSAASFSALEQAVQKRYRKRRFDVLWERSERPPLYQFPTPYPLRPDSWKAKIDEAGGHPLVKCSFGGRRWTLRLRGGWQFKRLLAAHKKIAEGTAVRVEASLVGLCEGKGRNKKITKLLMKMVAWFPREPQRERSGEMLVTTGGDAFCVATIGQRDPWRLNADHVRRWIAEHEKYRQRMSDDLKFEKRWPKHVREQMLRAQDQRCRRQNHRLKNFIGVASKMIAGYAARNDVALVRWDDTDRSYLPSFPWSSFRESLGYKLDELGIEFLCEGSGAEKSTATARSESDMETSQ